MDVTWSLFFVLLWHSMTQYFILSPKTQWIDELGRSGIGEVLEAAGCMRPAVRAEKGNLGIWDEKRRAVYENIGYWIYVTMSIFGKSE